MDRSTADGRDRRETTARTSPPARPLAALSELRRRDPTLFGVAALHAALFGAFAAGTVLDPTTLHGEPIWLKPAKFAGAIALVSATLGWLGPDLPVARRVRRRVSLVVAAGFVVEIVAIGGQAARGVGSHFNRATAFDAAVAAVMGLTITVVTCAIAVLAVRARGREHVVHPAFGTGIVLGIALFVVGAFEGGAMLAVGGRAVAPAGPTVPVMGWHLVGDFRVAHFVGLHALQVLPATGYLAARHADRLPVARPTRIVYAVAAGHAALFAVVAALAVVPLVG